MSRKELPGAGLVAAAIAGRISNGEGAAALRISPRQFQHHGALGGIALADAMAP